MQRKHHKPEEIVAKLRQVDLLSSHGVKTLPTRICQIGVSEVACYRWRQEFGGLKTAGQAGRCFLLGVLVRFALSIFFIVWPSTRSQ